MESLTTIEHTNALRAMNARIDRLEQDIRREYDAKIARISEDLRREFDAKIALIQQLNAAERQSIVNTQQYVDGQRRRNRDSGSSH